MKKESGKKKKRRKNERKIRIWKKEGKGKRENNGKKIKAFDFLNFLLKLI